MLIRFIRRNVVRVLVSVFAFLPLHTFGCLSLLFFVLFLLLNQLFICIKSLNLIWQAQVSTSMTTLGSLFGLNEFENFLLFLGINDLAIGYPQVVQ